MSESRTKKISKNIIYSLALKLSILLIQLISRIVFVKVLGANYLGISGLFTNILSILSMADLGINTTMMYSLYKPIAEADTEKVAALVSYFRKIYLYIAGVVGILGIAMLPLLEFIVKLDSTIPNLKIYYMLFLVNTVCTYLFVYRTILLSADQREYMISKYSMVFQYAAFFIKILILMVTQNYFFYLLAENICNVCNNIYLNHVTLKHYQYLKHKGIRQLESREKKEIFINVKAMFLYKLCGVIQGNTDSILLSALVGTLILGYYSNYMLIMNGLVSILYIIFNSIKASIGNLVATSETSEKSYQIFKVLELINFWLIGLCCVCIYAVIQDVIIFSFGKDYLINKSVVLIILLNFYTSNIRQSLWAYRETTGLFRQTKYITAVTAIVNLFLSLLLGWKYGIYGILGATVISRMLYAWWKEPFILYKLYFKKLVGTYYINYIVRLLSCIFAGICSELISQLICIENIVVRIGINFIISFTIFNIIFVILLYKTEEYQYLYRKMKTVLKN